MNHAASLHFGWHYTISRTISRSLIATPLTASINSG